MIPLLEIGVLAFPDGSEELIIFELRYRLLLKGLFEGTRKPRVFGLTVGGVGTLATLGAYNMMPDGCVCTYVAIAGGLAHLWLQAPFACYFDHAGRWAASHPSVTSPHVSRRARVTVHAGRRFSIVPGSTRAEPSTFGMVVGEVRFFDDNKAHDEGAQNKGLSEARTSQAIKQGIVCQVIDLLLCRFLLQMRLCLQN